MFVRVKRIKGQDYGYLVENSWTGNGTRQKVAGYLGRISRPERVKSESLQGFLNVEDVGKHVHENDFSAIIEALAKLELHNHNTDDKTEVDFKNFTVKEGGRNVVLALNDGHLCGHSIKKLAQYSHEEDYSGFLLADLITGAGIKIEKDVFVALFEKMQKKEAEKKAEKIDFYY